MAFRKLSSLKSINIKDKKVLLRVDFNVPIKNGIVLNSDRIKRTLPTIKYILKNGGSLIIASHMGRPNGRFVDELSTAPVAKKLSEILNRPVLHAKDCIGDEVNKIKSSLFIFFITFIVSFLIITSLVLCGAVHFFKFLL